MSVYKYSLYVSAALITIGGILLLSDNPRGILGEVDLESKQNITAYAVAHNTDTRYFDKQGQIHYIFKADTLSHFRPSDDETEDYSSANNPEIQFFDKQSPWQISAQQALVDFHRIITLSESVVLANTNINGDKITMHTEQLTLDPTQKLAHTNEPVTIRGPLSHITADGMSADLNARIITLQNRVRGVHKPEKKP